MTGKTIVSFEGPDSRTIDQQVLSWLLYNNITVGGMVEAMKEDLKVAPAVITDFLDGYAYGGQPTQSTTVQHAPAVPTPPAAAPAAPAMAQTAPPPLMNASLPEPETPTSALEQMIASVGLKETESAAVANGRVERDSIVQVADGRTGRVKACFRGKIVVQFQDETLLIVTGNDASLIATASPPPTPPAPVLVAPGVAQALREQAAKLIETGKTTPEQVATMLRSAGAVGPVQGPDGTTVEKANFMFITENRMQMVKDHLDGLSTPATPVASAHGF